VECEVSDKMVSFVWACPSGDTTQVQTS